MVFDVQAGIYWRPEEGGLLWGMSNPDEPPGVAREFDHDYFATMRARVADLVPVTAELGLRAHLGGDHRLHARPPADPRAAAHRRRPGRRHRRRGRRRPRDDVGPGRLAGRRRPRCSPGAPTSSTSPTSGSTGSTPTAAAGSTPTRSPCPSPRGPDVTTAITAAPAGRLERRRPRGLGPARGGDRGRDAHPRASPCGRTATRLPGSGSAPRGRRAGCSRPTRSSTSSPAG